MELDELESRDECPEGLTALSYHSDGLHMAVGTSSGHAVLYDLRAPKPVMVKDHRNELKIHSVCFQDDKLFSADSKVVKIWEFKGSSSSAPLSSLETTHPSTDLLVWPDSGLM